MLRRVSETAGDRAAEPELLKKIGRPRRPSDKFALAAEISGRARRRRSRPCGRRRSRPCGCRRSRPYGRSLRRRSRPRGQTLRRNGFRLHRNRGPRSPSGDHNRSRRSHHSSPDSRSRNRSRHSTARNSRSPRSRHRDIRRGHNRTNREKRRLRPGRGCRRRRRASVDGATLAIGLSRVPQARSAVPTPIRARRPATTRRRTSAACSSGNCQFIFLCQPCRNWERSTEAGRQLAASLLELDRYKIAIFGQRHLACPTQIKSLHEHLPMLILLQTSVLILEPCSYH